MSKKDAQKSHFKRRLFERYSLQINDGEYDFLVSKIKNNDKSIVTFLLKQSNRITVHILKYKNLEIIAIYDKIRKSLVTALPENCREINKISIYATEFEENN